VLLGVVVLWVVLYASFTLGSPALLDDADSVHAEVAREMLLRHDFVTLYANGVRYLEKAPLFYWSMAGCMRVAQGLGASSARAMATAARVPLALAMLALTLLCEALARRLFRDARAGMYAAAIVLTSFGLFLFTRILIPDALVCLWTALAMYCFWRTEELENRNEAKLRLFCGGFAVACALNVLTKGLIGVVFPVAIAFVYLYMTRGMKRTLVRLRELHPWATLEAFLLLAVPWHILAGLANPTQGHPTPFRFVGGHWMVPLPTDGNVRGWTWFYLMNEHLLRYVNLRVPHDYDTAPQWLFWGLCLVWVMPWSAFLFKAMGWAFPGFQVGEKADVFRSQLRRRDLPLRRKARLLLLIWAGFVMLFFSISTRQEYYVLPALPALGMLIAGWLGMDARGTMTARAARRCLWVPLALGAGYAVFAVYMLLHVATPVAGTDISSLLTQNPTDYALSLGHFLDLNARALGLFRWPLGLSAGCLLVGPLVALLLRRRGRARESNLVLAGMMVVFLVAAHLALQTFAPALSSAQLAEAIAPQVGPGDVVCIHGEYEAGSTLAFTLQRPYAPGSEIHILEGRSSNLWYGSFFADAPKIFETPETLAAEWAGPRRVFLWQSLTDAPNQLPKLPGPVYILVKSGGKEIVSNRPNR